MLGLTKRRGYCLSRSIEKIRKTRNSCGAVELLFVAIFKSRQIRETEYEKTYDLVHAMLEETDRLHVSVFTCVLEISIANAAHGN